MPSRKDDLLRELAAIEAQEHSAKATTPQDHRPKQVTTVKQWKKASADTELELPSGNVCRVKRPGIVKLLKQNIIPDVLTPMVQDAITAAEQGDNSGKMDQEKLRDLMSNDAGIEALMDTSCRIAAECVLEPTVLYHRRQKQAGQADQIQESYKPEWEDIPEDERDPDLLYTDEVDMDDLVFIMQFVVGGTRDLEEFRRQSG